MIQVQYFQSLLQAKIYLHFALWNSLYSAARKVGKNTQRMVTKRYYSLAIDAKKFDVVFNILRFETSNDIPFNPKIGVKCVKRGTASTRIVSVVLTLNNILRNSFFTTSRSPYLYACLDVNDVLTLCDFTQSYCKLLMGASAWMKKGNTVKTKAHV